MHVQHKNPSTNTISAKVQNQQSKDSVINQALDWEIGKEHSKGKTLITKQKSNKGQTQNQEHQSRTKDLLGLDTLSCTNASKFCKKFL